MSSSAVIGTSTRKTNENRAQDSMLPHNSDCQPTLTDLYQLRMVYSYWQCNKFFDEAHFDVYYRTPPFGAQYVVLAGVDELVRVVSVFRFTEEEVNYVVEQLGVTDTKFNEFLSNLTTDGITIRSQKEGSLVFPHEPIMVISGPLGMCQLLETLALNLLSFPCLVATKASILRRHLSPESSMVEFGLRRAQGPNGGLSASLYSYLGGCEATSNVRAGLLYGIPICGTTSHAYITSFHDKDLDGLMKKEIKAFSKDGSVAYHITDIGEKVNESRNLIIERFSEELGYFSTNDSELASFIQYAISFPMAISCLIDTYDTIGSGLINYLALAVTILEQCGDAPITLAIRIDSGDLAYLSSYCRQVCKRVAEMYSLPRIAKTTIVASNSINEEVLESLEKSGHSVDIFGIGTNLVTCQGQPALGLVFKLSQIGDTPKMKMSSDIAKYTVPYNKNIYRLYNSDNQATLDLIQHVSEPAPVAGDRIFARHLTHPTKKCYVIPASVESLLEPVYVNGVRNLHYEDYITYMRECRDRVAQNLKTCMRDDMTRIKNPTPYKVSVTQEFFEKISEVRESLEQIKTIY